MSFLHDILTNVVANLLADPIKTGLVGVVAWLLRDRKVNRGQTAIAPPVADGEVPEARSWVVVVLDWVILVAFVAVFGPPVLAMVFAAAAVSSAISLVIVVLSAAFFIWTVWSLYKAFTEPSPEAGSDG